MNEINQTLIEDLTALRNKIFDLANSQAGNDKGNAAGVPVGANYANVLGGLREVVYQIRDHNLIGAIKALRANVFPGMCLKESKDIVEFLRDNR